MKANTFSYQMFSERSGVDLHDFMEPIIADAAFRPDQNTAERMFSELDAYDHYHLVYALLLCFRTMPQRLIAVLPHYLGHAETAVCSTALNLLDEADGQFLSEQVLERAQHVRDAHPERPFLANVVSRLEGRFHKTHPV